MQQFNLIKGEKQNSEIKCIRYKNELRFHDNYLNKTFHKAKNKIIMVAYLVSLFQNEW